MIIWKILFFPGTGVRNSPLDIYLNEVSPTDQAKIKHRLYILREREIIEWLWIKKIGNLYQLTVDDYRIYFGINERNIIVCYICRKVTPKARKIDLNRAENNFSDYLNNIKR